MFKENIIRKSEKILFSNKQIPKLKANSIVRKLSHRTVFLSFFVICEEPTEKYFSLVC